jgi:hypothetical protein
VGIKMFIIKVVIKMKIFGNNINPDCSYCCNGNDAKSGFICICKKQIKNGKCRKFKYNPTLRVPQASVELQKFTKEDFEI